MRKTFLLVLVASVFLAGCASPFPVGIVYTGTSFPVAATDNVGTSSKVGVAECKSVLALVSTGDCSLDAAKKNGGITKVNHVDWDANNVLGIYGTYKLTVYGN